MVDWSLYAPILIILLVAILGYFAIRRAIASDGWYQQVVKSSLTPPNWIFGIVWFILYGLIAYVWVTANISLENTNDFALLNWLFTIHIILNLAWSFLFFGDGNIVAGFIVILLMIITLLPLIYLVRANIWSVVILIIYLLWLIYALFLSWYIMANNTIIRCGDPGYPSLTW